MRALLAGMPQRDRVRRRPHARSTRSAFERGRRGARVLGDQHGVAHRLAAAEPADRGDGQLRRHALDLRDDARQRRAAGGAGAGRRDGACRSSSSPRSSRTLSYNDPQRDGAEGSGDDAAKTRRAPRPQRGAAGARPAVAARRRASLTNSCLDRLGAICDPHGPAGHRLRPGRGRARRPDRDRRRLADDAAAADRDRDAAGRRDRHRHRLRRADEDRRRLAAPAQRHGRPRRLDVARVRQRARARSPASCWSRACRRRPTRRCCGASRRALDRHVARDARARAVRAARARARARQRAADAAQQGGSRSGSGWCSASSSASRRSAAAR